MNTDKMLLLGIDIGTTGAKCTFYNLDGFPVASGYQEYPMVHPKIGWVEENPNDWWQAVYTNIRNCINKQNVNPEKVAGIGVSCTNSFIPLDKDGNALYNAILQLDQRSAAEVEWVRENLGTEYIYEITGNRIARGTFSLPTLRWFLNNRPDIMEKTYKFVVPSGFIIQKLTGKFSVNHSRMGFTLLGNIHTGEWDRDLVEKAGISYDILPQPYKAYDIVGGVTVQAAAITGLKLDTPVIAGAMDTVSAAIGAGATEEGDIFLALGTCGRLCHATEANIFDNRLMNCRHAVEGQWLNVAATNGSGISMRWFRDTFGKAIADEAEKKNLSIYDMINELAEQSTPGANGVIYLPYISGERCPIWDPDAKGVFFGIHLGTTYGDIARAIMEGVAFSIKQSMDIIMQSNTPSLKISLSGGIGKSKIWSQIFADILGYPIVSLTINETETLGCAILAAYGVGLINNISVMAKKVAENCELLNPDSQNTALYNDYFEIYKNLYEHLKDDFQDINRVKIKYTKQ